MQHFQQNNNQTNNDSYLISSQNEKFRLNTLNDPSSRVNSIIPNEPIFTVNESDNDYLLRTSDSKSDNDYMAPSYDDTIRYDYELPDGDDNEENEGPYEALKRQEDAKRTPLQNKLFYFFETPISTWAKAYSWLSLAINLASISILCIDSIPSMMGVPFYEQLWYRMDIAFVTFFTAEYLIRFYISTNKLKYLYQPTNVIDLISIISMFIQISISIRYNNPSSPLGPALRFVGILRLFRIIKLLQIPKHANSSFNFSSQVFIRSAYQLFIGSIYAMIIIIVSSVFMYYAERGEYNSANSTWYRYNENGQLERSPFQSVVHSFWWAMVTITTTGYGDIVPVTPLGKLIASLTMTLGILAIALPTTIIGSNFMAEWAVRKRAKFQRKMRKSDDKSNLNGIDRSKVLQVQNDAMLGMIIEIQERLAEINPTYYFIKYRDFKEKHRRACKRISELEVQLEKQKRITNNFDIFLRRANNDPNHNDNHSEITLNNSSPENVRKMKIFPFRKSKTISSFSSSGKSYSSDNLNPIYGGSRNIDPDNRSGSKLKVPKLFPIETLKKIGRTLSFDDNRSFKSFKHKKNKSQDITISSPIEINPTFTPIIEDSNSGSTAHPGNLSVPKEKRPLYRRNHSSPGSIPKYINAGGNSESSVNPIINNKPRGIFVQDSNVSYPVLFDDDDDDVRTPRVIRVDQSELQNNTGSTSHNKESEIDRIEILVDDQ